MKKNSKNAQAAKGTLKISSFFTSQSKLSKDSLNTKKGNCNKIPSPQKGKNTNIINEDCDVVNVGEIFNTVNTQTKNEKCGSTEIISTEVKVRLLSPTTKKRKAEEINGATSPPQKRSNRINVRPLSPNSHPSTSEYILGNVTPTKNSHRQIISVKSPEVLLTPEALREYNTPEKKLERFMTKIRTPTPKKLLFDDDANRSLNSTDSLLAEVDKLIKMKQTPKKISPDKSSCSTTKANTPETQMKTPNKQKKTPKLFNKSPNNLKEFNVQIIDNFVKITPSKSNKLDPEVEFVNSTEKKQSSILKYLSPTTSSKSLQAQRQNESTPTKESPRISRTCTPKSKVKTKLNFSECAQTSSKVTKMPENVDLIKEKTEKLLDVPVTPSRSQDCRNYIGQENDLNSINIDFNLSEDWQEEILEGSSTTYNLDLSLSQHCKVINVNPSSTKNVITLQSTKNGEKAICSLEGFWMNTHISIGDTIHVSAKKLNEREWVVNNEDGLVVYEPDLLISTTSVVNTLWCKRKSVLSDRFSGFEPTNQQMLVGTLVHSLLQHVLKHKKRTKQEIEKIAKDLIKERSTISRIYECGLTMKVIEDEVLKFIPKIVDFMNLYVTDTKSSNLKRNKEDWKGTIKTIDDIEENIWCPELGIKGKVDVSIKTDFNTMPLELKTGRATVSLEHRGQVMMYIMMMNKLGYNVPSGLLLYLREGVLREISITEKEQRDIIILRNELTHYLTKKPRIENQESSRKLFPPDLPEPINHSSCAKCPYNVICTSYAKYNNEDISSKKVLKNIQEEVFFYIEKSHLDYFMHWVSLIGLESNSNKGSKNLREIYTLPPKERESNGKCIIDLKVINIAEESNGMFAHIFEKAHDQNATNFFANGIMESNYVVISVDNRPAVSSGFVTDITAKSITVTLDRDLNKKYAGRTFFIDSYDSSSIQSYNLASLTVLLELTPRAEKLRQIIIDKIPPTFKLALPKVIGTKGKQILRRLNIVQQRAVLKAIAAKDYFLIKGMPGTGKTSTIVALIQLLVELNRSVLITSHTHSAVDNVCLRLIGYGVKVLRLGSELRIHRSLKEFSEHNLTKDCTTPEQLEAVYNGAQVIAVTCLGSGHPVLTKRTMDICIVDESTQVLQCSVIRPLHAANTFILIGDQDQLPPVIQNKEAIEMGMSESLFERLYSKESGIALNLNYRMNSTITALANLLTYNGELLIGNESIANAVLNLPNKKLLHEKFKDCQWILRSLDDSLDNSVQFLDSGPTWNLQRKVPWAVHPKNHQNDQYTCVNIYEAAITFHLAQGLLKGGVSPTEIGVIATYRAQVAQISALLQKENIDISTVDQFQGKDKSVIIYSAGKSRDSSVIKTDNKFELLEDKRRLTVAITRAKHKLIIVGDIATLKQYSTFKAIESVIDTKCIKLQEMEDFFWDKVLDISV